MTLPSGTWHRVGRGIAELKLKAEPAGVISAPRLKHTQDAIHISDGNGTTLVV